MDKIDGGKACEILLGSLGTLVFMQHEEKEKIKAEIGAYLDIICNNYISSTAPIRNVNENREQIRLLLEKL